jgi:hypothetical protein
MRRVSALFLALVALGCGEPEIVVTRTELFLEYSEDPACRPPSTPTPTQLSITALGDYRLTEGEVEIFPTNAPIPRLDALPLDTQALRLTFTSDELPDLSSSAIHFVAREDGDRHALMLPRGRSCASRDTEAVAPPGAAVVALSAGGYFVAGGLSGDGDGREASSRVVIVPADGTFAVVTGGLGTSRVGATATLSGDRILVAGGAQRDREADFAEESFEVFDAATGQRDPSLGGRMCDEGTCRRRDHGAVAMASGWVLLVGGVPERGGVPLDTAVAIDPSTGEVDTSYGRLPVGRRAPQAVKLDDATILVVGGYPRGGAFVGAVYFLDAADREFVEIDGVDTITGRPLPDRDGAVAVALPGQRLAFIGGHAPFGNCDDSRDDEVCVNVLSFAAGPRAVERVDVDVAGFVPLSDTRAVARPDGRIFVVGVDDAGDRRAFVVDVGRGVAESVALPTQTAPELALLADGVIAEIGTTGTSYRRDLLRTVHDSPPATLLPDDVEWIAPDVADHFRRDPERGGLTALVSFARIDVPTFLSSDTRVTPTIDGSYELLLIGELAMVSVDVTVDTDHGMAEALVGTCRLAHRVADPLSIERRGEEITFRAGTAVEACPVDGLTGPIRLALRLADRSTLRSLGIERL